MKRREFLKLTAASLVAPSLDFPQELEIQRELHFWTNDIDYVIAYDEEDAKSLVADTMYGKGNWWRVYNEEGVWGISKSTYIPSEAERVACGYEKGRQVQMWKIYEEEVMGEGDWLRYSGIGDKDFTLHDIDENTKETKKAHEWVDEYGRCYFACSEW